MQKQVQYIIKGMQRDPSISKAMSDFSFENMNIRITAREENTLLSVTNEKGNKEVVLGTTIEGILLGHCVLNNFVILFSKGEEDNIYRIESTSDSYNIKLLYSGNLGFNTSNPIEAIGIYENENIQKVYWTDGLNQPRVINIVSDEETMSNWSDNSFDFVRTIELQEQVNIDRNLVANGVFAPGVLQYSFSYYNRYGQESNIFYTSPLYYVSYNNRGADAEDKVGNSFNITIKNLDKNFEFVRIYSTLRTSIDATPEARRVVDLAIPESGTVSYTDNGTTGDTIDPTELLYLGGEAISAYTMTHKDNTLFFGNLELKRKIVNEETRDYFYGNNGITFTLEHSREIVPPQPTGTYPYSNQLKLDSRSIKTFKYLEYYRFGLQFQHKTGKWSEPIWVNDVQNNVHITCSYVDDDPVYMPVARMQISGDILDTLRQQDFIRVRPVIVFPTLSDRECICQGILCPTVYNVSDRYGNSPFAQSSWFVRANAAYDIYKTGHDANRTVFTLSGEGITASAGDIYTVGTVSLRVISLSGQTLTCSREDLTNDTPLPPTGQLIKVSGEGTTSLTYTAVTETWGSDWGDRDKGPLTYSINSRAGILANSRTLLTVNKQDTINMDMVNKGAWAEFRHNYPIPSNDDRRAEIQCIWNPPANPYLDDTMDDSGIAGWVSQNSENFYIDQSIVTLHSPDIEFDNDVRSIDTSGLKLRIVGVVPLTGFIGDIDIQTSTPANNYYDSSEVALGFYKEPVKAENISRFGWKALMSGGFWFDELSDYKKNTGNSHHYTTGFVVYPWHRNGSLNNKKWATDGYRPAMLDKKKISNLRFSYNSYYLSPNQIWNAYVEGDSVHTGISGVSVFDSNEVTLTRIPAPKNSSLDDINYYGNVDKVLTISRIGDKKNGYPIMTTGVQNAETNAHLLFSSNYMQVDSRFTDQITGTDPVRMKYKSTPHAVLALNYSQRGEQNILPTLMDGNISYPSPAERWSVNYVGGSIGSGKHSFWDKNRVSNSVHQDILNFFPPYTSYTGVGIEYGFLWLGELYNDSVENRFGGQTEEAFENNQWLPCGESVSLFSEDGSNAASISVDWTDGDTYYQRYDHLKAYPFTLEDQNAVTDIVSFMCETRVNIDGRYDRNRGQSSNFAVTPTNFNLLNDVYSQKDNFFTYRALNYKRFNLDYFPNTITWTKEKSLGELIDTWSNITMVSTLDLDGDKGEIMSLNTFNNEIFCFQKRGLSNILFNSRVQIPASDGVPIEITNGAKVSGKRYISNSIGCDNKWSIAESSKGLYFIDGLTNALYLFNGQLDVLSDRLGFRQWVSENSRSTVWNPESFNNFISFCDKTNDDVYFIKDNVCLCYSELLDQFTSFMSYEKVPAMFNVGSKFLSFKNGKLWEQGEGEYNKFFGEFKPYYITYRVNPEEPIDKIFNNIEFRSDTWNGDILTDKTFDTLDVWNEYQRGTLALNSIQCKPSPLKKKFRIWRALIPRDNSNHRDRIRNPWIYLRLSMNKENNYRTELHDLIVHYFE